MERVALTAAEANRRLGWRRRGGTAGIFHKRAIEKGESLGVEERKEDGIKAEGR